MKKRQTQTFLVDGEKTAAFIVAHAMWQKSRGRNPSEAYGSEKNPAKALELAYSELVIYHATAGQRIDNAASQMLAIANFTKRACSTDFNGINVVAKPYMSAADVVTSYHEASEQRAEEYRNSPEGKAAARRQVEELAAMQGKHDELVAQLSELDFSDDVALLDWLCAFQEPSDRIGVEKQQDIVVAMFEKHGYVANANVGDNFNDVDRDNVARYIIGQALDGLQGRVGAIHQVINRFVDDWKEKFVPKAA